MACWPACLLLAYDPVHTSAGDRRRGARAGEKFCRLGRFAFSEWAHVVILWRCMGPGRDCEHNSRNRYHSFRSADGTMAQVFFTRAQENCRNGMRRTVSAHRRLHTRSLAADKQEHMDEHFSIFMAGVALVCLAFFHWSIDIADFSRWAKPLIILGLNPITVYVLSEVLDTILRILNVPMSKGQVINCQTYMFKSLCVPIAKSETASLIYGVLTLLSMYLVAWIMWRKRLFIKI